MSFWAEKLNGTPSVTPAVVPQSRELYGLYNTPQAPVYQTVPAPQEYTPTVRLIQGSVCPGCQSTRYLGSIGSRAVACPDCGYHPRFEQSGYGERSLHSQPGQVSAARQPIGGQTMKASIALLNAGGGEHL